MYYLYNTEEKAIINTNRICANLEGAKWADIEYFDAINKWGFKKPNESIPCIFPYSKVTAGVESDEEQPYTNDWHISIES